MSREDLLQYRLDQLMQKHKTYDFPEFLSTLRMLFGIQRKTISEETGLSILRLFYLEHGRFKRKPRIHEIRALSEYYNIDFDFLKFKSEDFIEKGLGRPQGEKEHSRDLRKSA